MTGFFDPKYERGDRKNSMGKSNNFEFMVKPDGGSIFHVIVDEFGRTYFAKDKNATHDSGASAKAVTGHGPPMIAAIAIDIAIVRIVFIYSLLSSFPQRKAEYHKLYQNRRHAVKSAGVLRRYGFWQTMFSRQISHCRARRFGLVVCDGGKVPKAEVSQV